MCYIAEFTSDIKHVKGKSNVVADALSRAYGISATLAPTVDYEQLARAQQNSDEINAYKSSITNLSLQLVRFQNCDVLCDVSTGVSRPIVPQEFTKTIFNALHSISHAGPKPTTRAVSDRFVWHNLRRDIRRWSKECPQCQGIQARQGTPTGSRPPLPQVWQHTHRHCRTLTSLGRLHIPANHYRPIYPLAGSNPHPCSNGGNMRQSTHTPLDRTLRPPRRHHVRQRKPIHLTFVVAPHQLARHQTSPHNHLPPPS